MINNNQFSYMFFDYIWLFYRLGTAKYSNYNQLTLIKNLDSDWIAHNISIYKNDTDDLLEFRPAGFKSTVKEQ